MGSSQLNTEVENFFAEIEAMESENSTVDDNAPKTDWIVQVDPKTNTSYYCNCITKETTWSMPVEYQKYLTDYELYLTKGHKVAKKTQKDANENFETISTGQLFLEGKVRNRHKIKRAFKWLNANKEKDHMSDGPIEFLSEYIRYSSSSSSSSQFFSENGPEESQKEVREILENEKMDVSENKGTFFIGPRLPSPIPINTDSLSEFNNIDTAVSISQNSDAIYQKTLLETSQILIEKFTAIDIHQDKLSPLQVAYVQFATRYEDWKYGYLPNERYSQKLEEVKDFLLPYEQDSLSKRSIWDSGNKRYNSGTSESENSVSINPHAESDFENGEDATFQKSRVILEETESEETSDEQ